MGHSMGHSMGQHASFCSCLNALDLGSSYEQGLLLQVGVLSTSTINKDPHAPPPCSRAQRKRDGYEEASTPETDDGLMVSCCLSCLHVWEINSYFKAEETLVDQWSSHVISAMTSISAKPCSDLTPDRTYNCSPNETTINIHKYP